MKNPFSKKITDESYVATEKRFDAFFCGEVADRPPVGFTFQKTSEESVPPPKKEYASERDRWLDVEYRAAEANYWFDNTEYYADALPTYMPNLGPEIFSAMCGCPYHFRRETTWTEPCIIDLKKDADKGIFDRYNEYVGWIEKFTQELLKYSKDKFAVGFTDFHAGADHLAALRDPERLCVDLIENPEFVREKLKASYDEFFKLYEYFYHMITLGGEPATSWIGLVVDGRYNVVQNDFSCMVSNKMFVDFFLEGLICEVKHLDRSIYHLDGPDALRHLDTLLEIDDLDAVQWVPGAGNEGVGRWIKVYQKIQKAKKGIFLPADKSELDSIFANLKPDGIWFPGISGVNSKEEADYIIERIKNWK